MAALRWITDDRLHVDGLTPPEIARAAADRLGLPSDRVRVGVIEYNSQELYLFGEVAGQERSVPYQGPETILDLLQRVGGVAPGAAVGDIQILRSHVADGTSPELFEVDLAAILRGDQKTNVCLEPFDQIYIGQTKRSHFKTLLPPWLQALCERVHDVRWTRRPIALPAPIRLESVPEVALMRQAKESGYYKPERQRRISPHPSLAFQACNNPSR